MKKSSNLVTQPTYFPTRKVLAATLGSAIGSTSVFFATKFAAHSHWLGFLVLPEITALLMILGALLGAFVTGYSFSEWEMTDKNISNEDIEDYKDETNI